MTLSPNQKQYIAHVRKSDGAKQSLLDHLTGTAELAKQFANKIGLPLSGELIGLVHDLGKYSDDFQIYIKSATGIFNPDIDDEYVDTKGLKGKIDHSTAGGQWLIESLKNFNHPIKDGKTRENGDLLAQILGLCVVSHHSGLIDIVDLSETAILKKRLKKSEQDAHCIEAKLNAEKQQLFDNLGADWQKHIVKEFNTMFMPLIHQFHKKQISQTEYDFYTGFLVRVLFSCLIEADRSNSIAFEYPTQSHELTFIRPNWQIAIDKVEQRYQSFAKNTDSHPINIQRNLIAQTCLENAQKPQGIFSLTVPTGGGKTLSSLRFAVHHAKQHNLDRIIFIIPFTSIIEQNANEVRKILEDEGFEGSWVLEQHSNLESDIQTWQSKLIADNWNAPIVFTTMVQFLESCFGSGTKGVRRLHQMTNAVLVFDEIQTLPINCYHLFINAINFLSTFGKTTTILCTATQPVLDKLSTKDAIKNRGILHTPTEIIGNDDVLKTLFDTLKRVEIHDHTQTALDETAVNDFVLDNFDKFKSTLVIVNTKAWAMQIYQSLKNKVDSEAIFHLSTGQCAKHRKDLIKQIKDRLKNNLSTLVISTQLIEAGVDISFKSVVRFLAGLDSILQAAGRCNRHGEMMDDNNQSVKGQVFVITPTSENLQKLPTIQHGKTTMQHLFYKLSLPENRDKSLLHPEMVSTYFTHFYQYQYDEMVYPIDKQHNLLTLLSLGDKRANQNEERLKNGQFPQLWQSFMTASKAFKAIDAPTKAIVVPYGDEGKDLITDLCGVQVKDANFYKLVKKAQAFSVNVFPFMFDILDKAKALTPVADTGIIVLDEKFYDEVMGLNPNGDSQMEFLSFGEF